MTAKTPPIRLAIHGGAGGIRRDKLTPEREQAFVQVLTQSLQTGYQVLVQGGTSTDAVAAAIVIMEDSPVFNAGKGAVFSHEGHNELDASIMDGASLNAGAVAAVTTIRNPILAAQAVMTNSPHVMLIGTGAEHFAAEQGLEIVEPSYFFVQHRWNQLQKLKKTNKSPWITILKQNPRPRPKPKTMKNMARLAPSLWITTVISQPAPQQAD